MLALDDFNSCATPSSSSPSPPQPLLAITSGEPSDELADMVWSANANASGDIHRHHQAQEIDSEAVKIGPSCDAQFGGSEYSQGYFVHNGHGGAKFEHHGSDGDGGALVQQHVPMFALWNE